MQKCWYSKDRRGVAFVGMTVYAYCAIFYALWSVYFMVVYHEAGKQLFAFLCIFIAIIWAYFLIRGLIVSNREFEIEKHGITIRYLKRRRVFIPWEKVYNILVCDIEGPARNIISIVLRVSLVAETKGPLGQNKSWRKNSYLKKHYKEIIHIEYSEERYQLMEQNYPREIIEHFSKPEYAKNYRDNIIIFPK